jgi:hypothetical protein
MPEPFVVLAGLGQLGLAAVSLAIPRALRWREQTAGFEPLTRAVFWTYAGYIWGINVAMGLLATLGAHWLLDGRGLGRCVCGFIAVYWGSRLVIQLAWFDRHAPAGARYRVAGWMLDGLFLFLTVVFGAVALGW